MTLLLEHFDTLLATPADVEYLNRAILTLAVQGKLVAQEPGDEPASELIKRISDEIAQSNKLYKANKDKLFAEIAVDEQPFKLPNGWKWVRLGDLCRLENGDRSKKNYPNKSALVSEGIPFVNAGHLVSGRIDRRTITFITKARFDRLRSGKFRDGDILFCLRGSLGKSALVEGFDEGAIASSLVIVKIHPFLNPQYFLHYFNSPLSSQMIKKYDNGTAQPNLSAAALAKFLIPLPPLAEQKRIVARVETLFTQTSALAEKLARAESELAGLNRSALAHLLAADSPEEFNRQWDFIAAHFESLLTRPEHVAPLRQSILELAVRGKLTRREAGDESARELLKRIKAERVESGKKEVLAPVKESEKPFELPDGWEWAKLGSIADIGTGSTPSRSNPDYYVNGTIPWATSSATNYPFISRTDELITEDAARDTRLRIYPKHTLLVALYGQGKTRGQVSELLIDSTINQACASLVFTGGAENLREYIKLFLLKNYREMRLLAEGGAQPNLNLNKIKQMAVSIPPLAEQARIVARVEQLLGLCEALESRLRAAQEERSRLVESVLSTVGAGANSMDKNQLTE
ncbi:MAG: restriction endonuclease [Chloroflexi bacterium HGW-Chloroflexi-6]|nr:MAG: restriction endonuclease [Chloroflexi bacterium HGW-Chloroflexi-6]